MSDGEEVSEEEEEDPRIMKLVTYQSKHTPEELAEYLKELGGEDAIIYGDLYIGKQALGLAHFLLMGAALLNNEEELAPQIEKQKQLFIHTTGGNSEIQAALLVMLELFCCKERPAAVDEFASILKVLWNRDIVSQDVIEAWWLNERALLELAPKHWSQNDAEAIRSSAKAFIDWVQVLEEPKMLTPFEESARVDLRPPMSPEKACGDGAIPDEHLAAGAVLRARLSQLSSHSEFLLKAIAVRRLKAAVGEHYALICLQTKVKSFAAALRLTGFVKLPDHALPRLLKGANYVEATLDPVVSIKPSPVPQLSLEFVEDQTTAMFSELQLPAVRSPISAQKHDQQALGIARGSAVSAVRTASTTALQLSKHAAAAIASNPIIGSGIGARKKPRGHSPAKARKQESRRYLSSCRPEPPQAELLLFAQQAAFAALWPPNMSDAARGRPRTAPLLKVAQSFS